MHLEWSSLFMECTNRYIMQRLALPEEYFSVLRVLLPSNLKKKKKAGSLLGETKLLNFLHE